MADPNATLGDILAGSLGGVMPNRPMLAVQAAQAQTLNGLRSAQTEDAMQNAHNAQLEAQFRQNAIDARQGLSDKITAATGGNRQLGDLLAGFESAQGEKGEPFNTLTEGALNLQKYNNVGTLSDPAKLGTPAATAAQQGATGKVAEPVNVPNEYTIQAGMPNPVVQQTPLGAAQTAAAGANANLHQNEATNPQEYHPPPAGSGAPDPQVISTRGHLIATGAAQFPTPYEWARNPTMAGAVTRAALAENPATSQSLFPQVQSVLKDFSGEGKNGQRLIGYGTVENHLDLMHQAAAALQNGTFTPANALYQSVAKVFGSDVPTGIETLGPYIGAEVYRSLSGSQIGTGEERNQVQQAWTTARSLPQLLTAERITRGVLSGGENQLRNAYEAGTKGLAGSVPWVPTFDQIKNGQVPSGILTAPGGSAPAAASGTPQAAANAQPAAAGTATAPPGVAAAAAPLSLESYLKSHGF
jgi:hypothetical protein